MINLTDAKARLDRAHHHIAEFEEVVAGYLDTDFYRVEVETDQFTGMTALAVQSLHEPPQAIATVLGDAVSSLRSVLDYAAVALVAPITGRPQDVGFPFADNAQGFAGSVTKGSLSACSQIIQQHFISDVQAHRGGKGETFWILNKLRNIDKHRLLLTTLNVAGVRVSGILGGMRVENCIFGVAQGQRGYAIKSAQPIYHFSHQPQPVFSVDWQEVDIIERVSVPDFLHSASGQVADFLNRIETKSAAQA